MDRIPQALLTQHIDGANLRGATLGEHLGDRATVVAFLRHFG